MIPELGHFALIVALTLAIAQSAFSFAGAHTGRMQLIGAARPIAIGQFLFVAAAFAALAWSFVTSDFSVLNVATNSNSKLPAHYRFAASWGSHEGSILLWVLMLNGWTFAVALLSHRLPERFTARVLGVMGVLSLGFLLFILLTSNPFERLIPAAEEGRDLNPLLQDPGMVIHPPMLYMGYVGFSVAFAFAIAALLEGRLDAAWARWSRPWTTAAWCFLTVGIALGSAWAYYELGWVAFSLSLIGTFLVRSGVLTSVHAFATDPKRGVFILLFLALAIGGSLALFAWRAPRVGLGAGFEAVSRESMLLANNVFLTVAMAAVLLGTLYPLFLDALNAGKISVGPPYFDAVFYPLMAPAVFLMAIGPMARWKHAALPGLWTRLRWALAVSVAAALVIPFALGKFSAVIAFGLWLGLWVVAATASLVVQRLRASSQSTWRGRLAAQSMSWWGMVLAHIGVAVFIFGVTLVKGYEKELDLRMAPGDRVTLGSHEFVFKGAKEVPGPNYVAMQGEFDVRPVGGGSSRTMRPEKRLYNASGITMTEADIDTGFLRDLYVSLGEPVENGAWGVRVYYKPFVDWIWGGCFLMALGGVLAICDRRYRPRRASASEPAGAQAARA